MHRPFLKVVECRRGWLLFQKKNAGRVKHSCGWASKAVALGLSPTKYQDRLEELIRAHMRKAHA